MMSQSVPKVRRLQRKEGERGRRVQSRVARLYLVALRILCLVWRTDKDTTQNMSPETQSLERLHVRVYQLFCLVSQCHCYCNFSISANPVFSPAYQVIQSPPSFPHEHYPTNDFYQRDFAMYPSQDALESYLARQPWSELPELHLEDGGGFLRFF